MIKKLSILLLCVMVLVGCSSGPKDNGKNNGKGNGVKETVTVCTSDDQSTGYQSMTQTFTSLGDLVSVLEFQGRMDVGSKENVELLSSAMEDIIAQAKGIKGLTVEYKVVDETIIQDYTKIVVGGGDLAAIQELGLLQLTEDATIISLEESVKGLTQQGYVCSTK